MAIRFLSLAIKDTSTTAAGAALTALLAVLPLSVQAATLTTERAALGGNDQIDWSSLGPVAPFNFLPNSFSATSERGLGLDVDIPVAPVSITPPFVFQTSPPPGIPTNFANGDFVLFTGLTPGTFPSVGNPGPLTITFDTPVFGAGAQIAVDDTLEFTAFISAFDNTNTLLGSFQATGTSSLALDNSALFLGVRSDTANISKLVFSTSVPDRAVAINTLSIKAVPEPSSTLSLLVLGFLGAGSVLKRNKTLARLSLPSAQRGGSPALFGGFPAVGDWRQP